MWNKARRARSVRFGGVKTPLRLLFTTLLLLSPSARAQADDTAPVKLDRAQQLIRAAQAELAKQGLSIEPLPAIRAVDADQLARSIQVELAARSRTGAFEARRLLRDALAHKTPATEEEFVAVRARELAAETILRFDAASGALLYDGARPIAAARFELAALEQLVLAARERRTPFPLGAEASSRPTSETIALQAALRAGEAAVRAGAVLDARGARATEPDAGLALDPRTRLALDSGRAFMVQRSLLGGLGALDGAYDEQPASSEQLLHAPKLYRDRPRPVAYPEWSQTIEPTTLVCDDELGELGLLEVLLEAGVERDRARVAASGWDGDRMRVFKDKHGAVAQVWRLYFDRPEDVRQFVEVWRAKASGRIVPRALTCDWVRAESVALATALERELVAAPPKLQPSPEDQEITDAVEAELARKFDIAPTLEGSLWRVPQFDFSMRVPESWRLEVFEGVAYVFAAQVDRYRDNISVADVDASVEESSDELLARQSRLITKQQNLRLIKAEKRIVDGRQGIFLRYSGATGAQALEFAALMFVRNQRVIAVTTSASQATWPALESMLEAAYRTIEVRVSGEPIK